MARRPPSTAPQRPLLTIEQKRQGIEKLKRRIADLDAFNPESITKRFSDPSLKALEGSIDEALSAIYGYGSVEYRRYSRASHLDQGPVFMSFGERDPRTEAAEAREYITEGKAAATVLLNQAIKSLNEEIEDDLTAAPPKDQRLNTSGKTRVFVVHGRDLAMKHTVARFLEKIKLEAIILDEQPDQGMTIIEKFEYHAKTVAFAVVLMSPDDVGRLASSNNEQSRARQNVVFELGYFAARLGRGKTCLLRSGELEIPSDLFGIIYTDFDGEDGWKFKLARELKAAELPFDMNQVLD